MSRRDNGHGINMPTTTHTTHKNALYVITYIAHIMQLTVISDNCPIYVFRN